MIAQNSTLIDVAFTVCTGLDAAGITAVLTGGAATMLYAGEMLPSDDADFIIGFGVDKETEEVMSALGFTRNGRIYTNPNTRFTVEFPTGPLSVGAEIITEWAKRERGDECLYVLSAFDAVRDRLCGYFYYHDFSALAAAVAIAWRHDVDIAAIEEWGEREFARDRSYDQVKKVQFFAESLQRNQTRLADPNNDALDRNQSDYLGR